MIGHWYYDLLQRIMHTGATELNQRTRAYICALPNQVVEVDCSGPIPTIGLRRTFPHVAAAELAWTLSGTKSIEWLCDYTQMWENFAEKDRTIEAAYGYRWRCHFGRDQFVEAIESLARDRTCRQVVVMAWDPASDGLLAPKKKNVPCPLGFSLCSGQ
jgi:thymidylate synthase